MNDFGRLLVVSCAIFSGASLTGVADALTASQRAEVIVVSYSETGEETETLKTAEKVLPGETVRFTVAYQNDKEAPIENLTLDMPVPANMTYVEDSGIYEGVLTLFSADDGNSYHARDDLRTSSGEAAAPATEADITNLRWIFADPVESETVGEISFSAVLK
jgi:uncharacterized repeat protein (TIGR01451 family)